MINEVNISKKKKKGIRFKITVDFVQLNLTCINVVEFFFFCKEYNHGLDFWCCDQPEIWHRDHDNNYAKHADHGTWTLQAVRDVHDHLELREYVIHHYIHGWVRSQTYRTKALLLQVPMEYIWLCGSGTFNPR